MQKIKSAPELCQMFVPKTYSTSYTVLPAKFQVSNFLMFLLQSVISQPHPGYASKGRDRHYFTLLGSQVFLVFIVGLVLDIFLNFTPISFSNLSPTWTLSALQATFLALC